jgi:hypothetical protein
MQEFAATVKWSIGGHFKTIMEIVIARQGSSHDFCDAWRAVFGVYPVSNPQCVRS